MVPPPSVVVEKRRLCGCDIAVVHVHPADGPPVRYDGRIWIRSGPRRGIASRQDENLLNEKRRYRYRPFDAQPVSGARGNCRSCVHDNRTSFTLDYLGAQSSRQCRTGGGSGCARCRPHVRLTR